MAPYQYQPLNPSKREIRILYLHPGLSDEPIRISISHTPLYIPEASDKHYRTREELQFVQKQLPENCLAWRTLEGRLIYYRESPSKTLDEKISGQGAKFIDQEQPRYCSWEPPVLIPGYTSDEGEKLRRPSCRPKFEAVSYVWGSIDTLIDLEVVNFRNATEIIGTVQIGPNLYKMLHYLRQEEQPRALWIDAICINQNDLIERGEQVKSMRNLYTFASRVIVWLGEATEDSALAMQTLEYIGKQIEYTTEQWYLPAPGRTEKDWWDPEYRIPLSEAALVAIARLVQRPYFERLWVMQEIQLANDLCIMKCGDVEVLWYHIRRALVKCHLDTAGLPGFSSALMYQKMTRIFDMATDLRNTYFDDLFHVAWYCQCVNPRDKIYAILGMLPQSIARRIEPQYSLPVEQIYSQIFLECVIASKRLDLLGIARRISATGDTPSWVPGLDKPKGLAFDSFVNFAGGLSSAHVSLGEPGELCVLGVSQDEVESVSPITPNTFSGIYSAARKLFSVKGGLNSKMTKQDSMAAFLWIFCFGELRDRYIEVDTCPTLDRARYMVKETQKGQEPIIHETFQQWYQAGLLNMTSKRFFVTRKGYLGCGYPEIETGDKIAIFLGCGDPTVLRPASSATETIKYKIVGRSYVHGLMETQALLGPIPDPWKMVYVSFDLEPPFDSADAPFFMDTNTTKKTSQDPRLDALPEEWEAIEKQDEFHLPFHVQHHRNKETGKIINSDPRMLPEALKARGVHVETFILV